MKILSILAMMFLSAESLAAGYMHLKGKVHSISRKDFQIESARYIYHINRNALSTERAQTMRPKQKVYLNIPLNSILKVQRMSASR